VKYLNQYKELTIVTCWAIIPARGGSKGIKDKNIKLLNGKPLIQYAIDSLHEANCFDKIIVTSDSEKILSRARDCGAEAHLRLNFEESNDIVMPDIPTISCLEGFSSKEVPDFAFMIQCTSPFITPQSYRKGFTLLQNNPESTVFAAVEAHINLWQESDSGHNKSTWQPINHPFHERIGRQFVKKKQVNEIGAFYGFRTSSFIEAKHRFFSYALPVFVDEDEVDDIDTMEDWALAEYKITKNLEESNEN
tara:strand:- start:565 stop:1311 length:747 start_codon:yes stop_codon:yes gene_type:complete